jgi:hypothetical protein
MPRWRLHGRKSGSRADPAQPERSVLRRAARATAADVIADWPTFAAIMEPDAPQKTPCRRAPLRRPHPRYQPGSVVSASSCLLTASGCHFQELEQLRIGRGHGAETLANDLLQHGSHAIGACEGVDFYCGLGSVMSQTYHKATLSRLCAARCRNHVTHPRAITHGGRGRCAERSSPLRAKPTRRPNLRETIFCRQALRNNWPKSRKLWPIYERGSRRWRRANRLRAPY